MTSLFSPFRKLSRNSMTLLLIGQVVAGLILWQLTAKGLIPTPGRIAGSLGELMQTRLLWDNILISLGLTVKAMLISILITLVISYLSVLPFFKGIAAVAVKARYLTLAGLIFIFTLLTSDGGQLKLSLLIFGIVPFFVTSFLSVITHTNKQEYELCRTLGYNDWETLYEVIIIGKADQVLEIIRQNFAIAWLMITLVEGLSMSEGGIGTLLIKYNKYADLNHVLALQALIFGIGIGFDYLLGTLRHWLFPYSKLKSE